eukprot:4452397-Pleurochrysis_carterae.AAC.1
MMTATSSASTLLSTSSPRTTMASDYDHDSADSPGGPEINAVTTDVDSISTPSFDDWQADLFGVIPHPASAHAAWTDDCCDEID